jgi:hypothetical protein
VKKEIKPVENNAENCHIKVILQKGTVKNGSGELVWKKSQYRNDLA